MSCRLGSTKAYSDIGNSGDISREKNGACAHFQTCDAERLAVMDESFVERSKHRNEKCRHHTDGYSGSHCCREFRQRRAQLQGQRQFQRRARATRTGCRQ